MSRRSVVIAIAMSIAAAAPASAQDSAITPPGEAPADIFPIPFDPPLDHSLWLERTVTRQAGAEQVVKKSCHELIFTRLGRGYALSMRQDSVHLDGPAEIVRLYGLSDQLIQGETLHFVVDGSGQIVGGDPDAQSYAWFLEAVARLRADRAFTSLSERDRAVIGGLLDQLTSLDADQQQQLFAAPLRPILAFAGTPDRAALSEPFSLDMTENGDVVLSIDASDAEAIETRRYVLSRADGLVRHYRQDLVIVDGGGVNSEEARLAADPDATQCPAWRARAAEAN